MNKSKLIKNIALVTSGYILKDILENEVVKREFNKILKEFEGTKLDEDIKKFRKTLKPIGLIKRIIYDIGFLGVYCITYTITSILSKI